MIRFEGEYSPETVKFIFNREKVLLMPLAIILTLITAVFCIALAIQTNIWIISLFTLSPMVFLVALFLPPIGNKKSYSPLYIDFDEEGYMEYAEEHSKSVYAPSDICEIIDYGKFYYILYERRNSMGFVCQKDLIVEGSIEDFEHLFKDKIVIAKNDTH